MDRAARRRLGRSLAIREVDAGSCNGCELEIHALNNAFYDLERFGIRFVASPRHADVLVTGPVTKNMQEALLRTYQATPDPKWVVAVGDCAIDGGVFAGSYAVKGGVSRVLPVDLHIRGHPPRPIQLLEGLLALLEAGAPVPTSRMRQLDGLRQFAGRQRRARSKVKYAASAAMAHNPLIVAIGRGVPSYQRLLSPFTTRPVIIWMKPSRPRRCRRVPGTARGRPRCLAESRDRRRRTTRP